MSDGDAKPRTEAREAEHDSRASTGEPPAGLFPTDGLDGPTGALAILAVSEEEGTPLEGVRLFLVPDPPPRTYASSHVDSSSAQLGQSPRTDRDGRARIEAPAGRAYRLKTGREGGTRPADQLIAALAVGEEREVVLRLSTANDLRFVARVVDDATGAPLLGARARAGTVSEVMEDLPPERRDAADMVAVRSAGPFDGTTSITVDGEGCFELDARSWDHLIARVDAPGYAHVFVKLAAGHESRTTAREVRLRPAAAVDVLVLDGSGAVLGGVEVEVSAKVYHLNDSASINEFIYAREPATWSGDTDASGRCRIEGLPPAVPLTLTAFRTRRDDVSLPDDLVLTSGEARSVELRFGGTADLWGWVRDPSGVGVGGVRLWLRPRVEGGRDCFQDYGETPTDTETSDPDGRFRFVQVPDGEWLVGCSPDGPYAPLAQAVVVSNGIAEREPVVVADGDSFIEGRVLGPNDEPLEAYVFAVGKESRCHVDTNSDENGHFSLGPLVAGTHLISTHFASREGSWFSEEPVEVEAGTSGVILRMSRGGVISGRVVDPVTGESIAANVTISPTSSSEVRSGWVSSGASAERGFEFSGLAPRTYSVFASTSGVRVARIDSVSVAAGDEVTDLELVLQPGARLRVSYDGEQRFGQIRVHHGGTCVAVDGLQRGTDTTFVVPPGSLTVRCFEYAGQEPTTRERAVTLGVGELATVEFVRGED